MAIILHIACYCIMRMHHVIASRDYMTCCCYLLLHFLAGCGAHALLWDVRPALGLGDETLGVQQTVAVAVTHCSVTHTQNDTSLATYQRHHGLTPKYNVF